MIRLGAIGYGYRIHTYMNSIEKLDLGAKLVSVVDIHPEASRERMGVRADGCTFYDSVEEMLHNAKLDAVMIGTRCSLHTEMALKVLKTGLPLFLEKPVCTNEQDLERLENAAKETKPKVVVSFPLRFTPVVQAVQDIVASGRIGRIAQVQMYNNVPYGDVYFQNWYRDAGETGGLYLQKATHDFDYVNMLLGAKPTMVASMKTRTYYGKDHDPDLTCPQCPERETCLQSDFHKLQFTGETIQGTMCAYSNKCENEDSSSTLVMYDSGIHGVYTQNFFSKMSAQKRGCRLIGTDGMLEFDFNTNEIRVTHHHVKHVEVHQLDYLTEEHFGGDIRMAYHFLNVVRGIEESKSTLSDGILSAKMCLAAKKSAENLCFVPIV